MNINQWCSDFFKEFGHYNYLPKELKDFVKKAYKDKIFESGKYSSLMDYYNYNQHPFKYRLHHLFKGGDK